MEVSRKALWGPGSQTYSLSFIYPFIHITDIFQCLPEIFNTCPFSTAASKMWEPGRRDGARG